MQGAKRSDTRRYREHLQRRSAPVSRGQRGCDFSDSVDWGHISTRANRNGVQVYTAIDGRVMLTTCSTRSGPRQAFHVDLRLMATEQVCNDLSRAGRHGPAQRAMTSVPFATDSKLAHIIRQSLGEAIVDTRLTVSAHWRSSILPTRVEPVKVSLRTVGFDVSSAPWPRASRDDVQHGKPVSAQTRQGSHIHRGPSSKATYRTTGGATGVSVMRSPKRTRKAPRPRPTGRCGEGLIWIKCVHTMDACLARWTYPTKGDSHVNAEMSQTLTRTGPGTPMGNLMRRYWVPILLSSEIAEPDGPQYACRSSERSCWRFATPRGSPA